MKKLNYILPALYVKKVKERGRGVFTREAIDGDAIIEIAPVIVLSAEDRKHIDQTLLHDYIFEWGPTQTQCCMALGYVPLYNHSYNSNCEYEMNFLKEIITIKTVRPVKAGEELFINYNGDWNDAKPVWFDVK
jgi:uncharacterized protein